MKIKATIDKQELEIEVDEKELVKAGYVKAKKEHKRWRAKMGMDFWIVDDGNICDLTEHGKTCDRFYYMGNYYQTKELAQAALDRQLALVRVNDRISELNEGWVANLKDTDETKWFLDYDYSHRKPYLSWFTTTGPCSKLDFIRSSSLADQIIHECESDLKVIFGV